MGRRVAGQERGKDGGIASEAKAGIFFQELVFRPMRLAWEIPIECRSVVIKPDDQDEPPPRRRCFLEGNGILVITVVHGAVPADGQGVIVLSFPVDGLEEAQRRPENGSPMPVTRFAEDQAQGGRSDEWSIAIPDAIDGPTIGEPEAKPDLSIG